MQSRRLAKINQAIRETVSLTILTRIRDPRIENRNVTVTGVEVAPDLLTAKVRVSVMGPENKQALCLHGLHAARGFFQSKIADRLQSKNTPVLTFVLDQGLKRSAELTGLLDAISAGDPPAAEVTAAASTEATGLATAGENPPGDTTSQSQ